MGIHNGLLGKKHDCEEIKDLFQKKGNQIVYSFF